MADENPRLMSIEIEPKGDEPRVLWYVIPPAGMRMKKTVMDWFYGEERSIISFELVKIPPVVPELSYDRDDLEDW